MRARVKPGGEASAHVVTPPRIGAKLSGGGSWLPRYEGPYEVTPSSTAQTLATNGKRMGADVVVAPIPNNYGLITWNGSVLTVS